jgi:UDP-N-acetyl-D-glucosamine dehydrogenase
MKICIVGLGYVGLPLAIQFARAKVPVLGLDVDAAKVDLISQGRSYIKHIAQGSIEEAVKRDCLCASTDFSLVLFVLPGRSWDVRSSEPNLTS